MTYSGDPASSPLDQVRFQIQDTDDAAPLLQDAEINWLIAQEKTAYAASVEACRTIAGRYAGKAGSRTIGDVSITYGDLAKRYTDRADVLARRANRSSVPVPYLGGLSQGDKDTNNGNLDHAARSFPDDAMWDDPGLRTVTDR